MSSVFFTVLIRLVVCLHTWLFEITSPHFFLLEGERLKCHSRSPEERSSLSLWRWFFSVVYRIDEWGLSTTYHSGNELYMLREKAAAGEAKEPMTVFATVFAVAQVQEWAQTSLVLGSFILLFTFGCSMGLRPYGSSIFFLHVGTSVSFNSWSHQSSAFHFPASPSYLTLSCSERKR